MGHAVVDNYGKDPLRRFAPDMSWIGSSALHAAVSSLLGGKSVDNDDEGVTVTFTGSNERGDVVEIVARDSAERERVRLVIRAASAPQLSKLGVGARRLDERSFVPPPPGNYVSIISPGRADEVTRWELFNCIVIDVDPLPPPTISPSDYED